MEQIYKGHTIVASAWQILDTQRWQPKIQITWREESNNLLKAPMITTLFPTRDQAESEGLALAIKWIEDGKPNIFCIF